MFDFAWSEIAIIGAVAMIAIRPKDIPVAIKTVTDVIKKARRMAAEFQTHVDEMVREANLDDVKKQFDDIKNFNIASEVEKAVDPDGTLRNTFDNDPLADTLADAQAAPAEPVPDPEPEPERGPSFVPPGMIPPDLPVLAATQAEPPSFVPPQFLPEPEPRTVN